MSMPQCARCKQNIAVVFITKMEGGKTVNEGLCLKCAKELGIKPVGDLLDKFGITDDALDAMNEELLGSGELFEGLMNLRGGVSLPEGEGSEAEPEDNEPEPEEDQPSRAPTMPFFMMRREEPRRKEPELDEERPRRGGKGGKKKFLGSFAISLTEKAKNGKLDRVVGRGSETARVIQILNRRQKNNPCLIGEPGVGKTAVAEGLAQKIADGEVPFKLRDKEVWMLDMTAMVAGTQFRGQFEARMKSLIDEIKSLGNIILVIDEVHNLVGAGDAEGSMNAANILKPALSRGEVQVVGATTFKEYRKHIEKDSALERRFQPVVINEPTYDEACEIIRGVKGYYEDFHGVDISDAVANQAVYLADRYISDRFMPDKAIDLIDEACSDANLKNRALSDMQQMKDELAELIFEREEAMQDPDAVTLYERIAHIRSRESVLEQQLKVLEAQPRPQLTVDDLSRVIELWTKIPASRVKERDFERLMKLEERLKAKVIGQDAAIEAVSAAIRRRRAGISEKRKPVSFVFVGPTGVGKTELVKQLAGDLFDTSDALIRLDMSEYMEKHSVSKLIGAPPGYIGYDEAGQLTEKIRRRPYSVVLFDEIEKAHPDVLNMLLQILDDGRITDAQGRYVNFENAVIIMTSNAGSDRRDGSVGFGRTVSEQGREKALKALKDIMRPEFINRIDEVISFNQLSEADFARICVLMLDALGAAVARNGIVFTYDEALVNWLVAGSYSVKYGARNLRRLIEKEVEDKAAGVIISAFENKVQSLHATALQSGVVVTGA